MAISGFTATLEVDDAGSGGPKGGASTKFAGPTKLSLPQLTAATFDATELDQGAADPYEREMPTGTVKPGRCKGEMFFSKANYTRLQKLVIAGRGYTFILKSPDDLSTPGTPVLLTTTWKGYVADVGEVVFEKGTGLIIPFEIVVQEKPTGYT